MSISPGSDDLARRVENVPRLGLGNASGNTGDLVPGDSHVQQRGEALGRVDQLASLDEQIVRRAGCCLRPQGWVIVCQPTANERTGQGLSDEMSARSRKSVAVVMNRHLPPLARAAEQSRQPRHNCSLASAEARPRGHKFRWRDATSIALGAQLGAGMSLSRELGLP